MIIFESFFQETIRCRLFADGGNYSRDEAKLYRKKITKIKKQAPKKYKKIIDEYNKVKPQLIVHLNQTDTAVLNRYIFAKLFLQKLIFL